MRQPSRIRSLLTLAVLAGAACATTPTPTSVGTAVGEDATYRNKLIEVQGWIREYEEPAGGAVRTWSFVVVDADGNTLRTYVDDRDAEDIAEADRLVKRAREGDEPIVAVGYLRTGEYKGRSGGPRLELREVRFRDEGVKLGRRRDDGYRSGPRFGIGVGVFSGSGGSVVGGGVHQEF